ncbi:hypothetical protein FRC14_004415 [Serendipita sp. 396]|nr:hypothetical protein FRC14_004415 [Serendipita sp. 396]KAG8775095.1 hypothetical protein FRC15_000790 [Serendipita sp. 397]KAG8827123.1 hypothetical protein FRC19_005257 [Serendipita sp. 401]KAG8835793.1 hypothetical protein FRC18_012325 [Serendipita sp. 400]KAG8859676.1 hypothetical protein FRB91_007100 [Serendipita sp. 411]KAG9057487.1 hypothetical protein FS842_006268 [Serendipita sp. 407]
MVYIKSWSEYQAKAEKLYEEQPTRTRYCVRYRAVDGILILKVTDDKVCLKYKTQSSIMLNRFEAFNLSMMTKMQNRQPSQPPTYSATSAAAPSSATIKDVPMAEATPAQGTSGNAPATPAPGGASSNAAAKKKKPKKKK